jgi:hypothetical protein
MHRQVDLSEFDAQPLGQRGIDLERDHSPSRAGEPFRQDAESRSDLEDVVCRGEPGGADNGRGDAVILEEGLG